MKRILKLLGRSPDEIPFRMSGFDTRVLLVALLPALVAPATAATPLIDFDQVCSAIEAGDHDFEHIVHLDNEIGEQFRAYDHAELDAVSERGQLNAARATLIERVMSFVDLAARYQTRGDDCRAVLRREAVTFMARNRLSMAAAYEPPLRQKLPKPILALLDEGDIEVNRLILEANVCRDTEQQARERL